ncbi:MAG: DUF2059 domain-containing protein [Gammaproteobacteria bacterium]|nr:DUF2059 domain-containing protein [Gammaproteobacteria bacterium]MBU2059898.1 DUF2059 domain-containing protein [Gammaproteobacteria bacterium]MBU2175847.1 DUF2059 domain-containing protein [Gammaproteobacteria bacterium]MBU2247670.1 DUF2059 domain-containing protein [Gammaproteobacteria bacterium]MBU2346471.1 DUF2059 domain-containing protein [Gammaproteobacteria bacterium]
MKLLYLILTLCSFCVLAEPATNELLEVNGAREYFAKHQGLMTEVMISKTPELSQHRAVVEAWENKYFAWSKLRESLAPIYSERFTENETTELINFFKAGRPEDFLKTPTGRKYQALLPEINADYTKFGYEYMQKVSPFLDDMLQREKQL